MAEKLKTVYRYDAGGRGFRKAATVLIGLASLLVVFGIFWIKSWL
jgi:hypothetical protein